ncbi:Poly(A) RNA polymerase GLD2-A [Euphorbia peplus]|nr:Poly(A) RNA polymerase GLD2-A [Euphorbia peplus]
MSGGGGGDAPPSTGGEFLLSLLQRSNNHPMNPPAPAQSQFPIQQQQQPHLALDPAVAAVGPSLPYAPPPRWQSNGSDTLSSPWPPNLSPPVPTASMLPGLFGFPQNPYGLQPNGLFGDEFQRLGFSGSGNNGIHNLGVQQKQQQQLQFGSFRSDIQTNPGIYSSNLAKEVDAVGLGGRNLNGFERNLNGLERNLNLNPQMISNSRAFEEKDQRVSSGGWGKQVPHGGKEIRMPPPGFSSNPGVVGVNWEFDFRNRGIDHNVRVDRGNQHQLSNKNAFFSSNGKDADGSRDFGLLKQLERPGPPAGSNLHSVSASDMEESLLNLDAVLAEDGKDDGHLEMDDIGEELVDSLLLDGDSEGKNNLKQSRYSREKESRLDNRGQHIMSQRMRILKRQMECRRDINRLNAHFVSIYESLIPPEEEKAKQKQLLTLLERLVNKEWPQARLYLYGSCANSFGVLKSDVDVCLAIGDADVNKSEILLKLADLLQSDNLQNVQALTRARVPIVKLMDPVTGLSCDICINNVLAVVNTKLLRDYSLIDVRLRQLAFIVKHWAKSRGVNETYQGTLSSYAYVLMCIHFLQQRRPAILPCLQEMKSSYFVTVDDIQCSYCDQVEKLCGYGSRNKETIAQLVWAFFNYWAYHHDYANDVISVRRGTLISKREKDWTRRIGNDRHLICIEDPFETTHDLGRVVDKYSIKVLREEFERAANVMQYDPNPCVTLFEAYVPSRVISG